MSESDEEKAYESADEDQEHVTKKEPESAKVENIATTFGSSAVSAEMEQSVKDAHLKEEQEKGDHPLITKDEIAESHLQNTEPVNAFGEVGNLPPPPVASDEPVGSAFERLASSSPGKSSGWGLGGWGSSWGSSIISTATSSVSTFTHSVGEGLHSVLETAEAAFGAPTPEEMAAVNKGSHHGAGSDAAQIKDDEKNSKGEEDDKVLTEQPTILTEKEIGKIKEPQEDVEGEDSGWFAGTWGIPVGLSEVVHQTSDMVQKTGKSLVTGGLDVLETIGKKTYDVIAEGDHGIKKALKNVKEKPNLSQILREAKEDAEVRGKAQEEYEETRKMQFEAQFDDFQGLVQLEALEMLSSQCEAKLQGLIMTSLRKEATDLLNKELNAIKRIFESEELSNDEDFENEKHDFDRLVTDFDGQLGVNCSPQKLIQTREKIYKWLAEHQISEAKSSNEENAENLVQSKDVHVAAIQSLAEFSAKVIGHFHRVAQLLLASERTPVSSYKDKATSLENLTKVFCTEIGILASRFIKYLNTENEAKTATDQLEGSRVITNIYLEATNSSTYVQNAFQLLLPVLQLMTIESYLKQQTAS